MSHAFITVVIPFDSVHSDRVEACLRKLGNPPCETIRRRLDEGEFVHFMSMSVLRDEIPSGKPSYLIMEVSADGTIRSALERLATSSDSARVAECSAPLAAA